MEQQHDDIRSDTNLKNLHHALLTWWQTHQRIFPWRTTSNVFHMLMAEMMLRRTQARQVVAVYREFIQAYPDARTLAMASPEQVSASLYSLGLAWRVPAFQKLATALVHNHEGQVPDHYDILITLPGVGDYVAAAICAFAYNQPVILADTNTVRVVGRLAGVPTHAESRRQKHIRSLLSCYLDREHPRVYNYALLDLAARICTPNRPACNECPLRLFCVTGQNYSHPAGSQ